MRTATYGFERLLIGAVDRDLHLVHTGIDQLLVVILQVKSEAFVTVRTQMWRLPPDGSFRKSVALEGRLPHALQFDLYDAITVRPGAS